MPSTLDHIEAIAHDLLEHWRLADRGWTFRWDRAVRRAGSCRFESKQVTLSRPIFEIETNRPHARDVILHEIAHALAGQQTGHGERWRRWAIEVGAQPQRCHDLEVPAPKVIGACACGPRHHRVRMPDRRRGYVCRTCRSTIDWQRVVAGKDAGGSLLGKEFAAPSANDPDNASDEGARRGNQMGQGSGRGRRRDRWGRRGAARRTG